MVYMAGDNNLSEAGDGDLEEMRQVGSTSDVNVLVEFDNAGNLGTRRYRIQSQGRNELVEELDETDCGDPKVLDNFISWAVERYPAERYALILWNHGGGWEPSEMDRIARLMNARSYNVREAGTLSGSQMKKTLFSTSIKRILAEDTPNMRAICSDDGSGHSLDTIELGNVLSRMSDMIGKPIDILGMDACLMSNLEVAYQAAPYVKYIVASEESEPGEGWPYQMLLNVLVRKPEIKTEEFSAEIVKAYIDYYEQANEYGVTQSAFDLSKIEDPSRAVNELAGALMDRMPDAGIDIWNAQKRSMKFFYSTLWDLNHFSGELIRLSSSQEVKDAARNLQKAFKAGPDNFVIAESHLGTSYNQCCGASIYLIPPPHDISKYYGDLEFAKSFPNWPAMLHQYHETPYIVP
ncbi:MAG: hypothetical protein JW986_04850 [Methanotrichaceae archaeon]|nr:hypothetical protein [Methanotrichaceae archaeon]